MNEIILLVEDYDDTRAFMRILLEMKKFKVIEASDGKQAIECAKLKKPDLILMDIGLPLIDGIVATRQIRKLRVGKYVPIIAVTAFGSELDKRHCRRAAMK